MFLHTSKKGLCLPRGRNMNRPSYGENNPPGEDGAVLTTLYPPGLAAAAAAAAAAALLTRVTAAAVAAVRHRRGGVAVDAALLGLHDHDAAGGCARRTTPVVAVHALTRL
jgi:hypothetical protein